MRYRRLRNTSRNMSGYVRMPRKKGHKVMAKKKSKKKSARNRRATSRFNKATGKWESTGVKRAKRKTGRRKKASKKGAVRKVSARKAPRRKKTAPRKTAKKSGRRGPRKGARRNRGSGMSPQQARAFASSDTIAKQKDEIAKLTKAVESCTTEVKKVKRSLASASAAPASGGKKGSKKRGSKKRPRPGTKSRACAPFVGKRKRPVKCRPKPSKESLDGCGLAAKRHGEDPRETCGPGTPKPTGRALAEKRWHGKSRNVGNKDFWGD